MLIHGVPTPQPGFKLEHFQATLWCMGIPSYGLLARIPLEVCQFFKELPHLQQAIMPPAPCQGDAAYMDTVMSTDLPHKIISTINQCHIAHHMYFWSDLADGQGAQTSASISQKLSATPNSSWKWPIECPSKANVLIWSSFLCDSPLTPIALYLC